MSVEFLVKLRDAGQLIADAANDYLETLIPKQDQQQPLPDFDKLQWETRTGAKADYQQTSKAANSNSDVFQALQKKLQEHPGFWQHNGFKYWIHLNDPDTIDRRKA